MWAFTSAWAKLCMGFYVYIGCVLLNYVDKGRLLEEIERMDHVGQVDKELHLDARALHYVPEDEGRVGTAASHRDEHAGEGGWRMHEVDREHGTRTDALQVGS
jgi:hypothetical protein